MKFYLHNYILNIYQNSWKRIKFFTHFWIAFLKAFIHIWEQNSLRQFCLCFTLTLSHDIFQLPIYYRNMDFFVSEVPVFCEILNSLRGAERNLSAAETTLIRWKKIRFNIWSCSWTIVPNVGTKFPHLIVTATGTLIVI